MSLSLSLLGVFRARLNGEPITEFYSSKVRALLAYLAVEPGRQHPRPVLAALLWPDWDDRAALGNLRFSLSKLRQAIRDGASRPPFLLIDRDTLQINPAAEVWVDVHTFQQELRASGWESAGRDGQPECAMRSALEHLRSAMDLYRGPFLEGFSVGDSAAFEEWALIQREQLEGEARRALHGLIVLCSRLDDYAAAERAVRQLLDMDPWDELGNRRLMAVLVQQGRRNAALAHYTAYREELARELGCEPEEETQSLYAQIRDGILAPSVQSEWAAQGGADLPPAAAGGGRGRAPAFVAREQELARLRTLLDRALTGRGGMALISGEAGGGKTALLDEFARRAGQAHGDLIVLRGSCNAHGGAGDPYLPFREMFQALAGDVEGKQAGGTLSLDQARRAWQALPAVGAALAEHGPDLIDRLVPGEALLRHAEGYPSPPGAVRWLPRLREIVRRAREETAQANSSGLNAMNPQPDLFAQVTQVLRTLSVKSPLLLMIDDLQWTDGGTAALLFHLGRRLAGSRMLVVCVCRPEALEDPPDPKGLQRPLGSVLRELRREWGDVLIDLDRADGRAFVEAYVDDEPNRLGTAFRQALYDHTAGNPLFTVELMHSLQRDGALVQDEAGRWVEAAEPDWTRWPARVEAVIAGHLADLPEKERALLQAASVQGESFVAEVAARVLGWDEENVVRRLSGPLSARHRLVQAVSLDRLPSSGQRPSTGSGQRLSRYRFRHALVQGSAYRSLDAVQRARLHEATGRALEAIYAGEGGQALPPELAHHYEAAGLPLEAARWCLEAGQWAARLVAYDEVIAHVERGLALLEGVPASSERLRLELGLCLALVSPALQRGGWQAPALIRALERLFELALHTGLQDDPQRRTALVLLAQASTWSADPERGQRVGEQLLDLAASASSRQVLTETVGQPQGGDRQSLMLAHWTLGHSHWSRGEFIAAREHLVQALALHDPAADRPLGLLFAGEPGVVSRTVLGFVLWFLGYPDQSRDSFQQALAQAQEIEQPSSIAFVHLVAGVAYAVLGRDVAVALDHAQALRPMGEVGLFYGAWTDLLSGQAESGPTGTAGSQPGLERALTQAAEAESALQALGSGVGQAALLLVQAQLSVRAGRAEMGLQAVDRATAWIEQTGVRLLEAEVWRMRGELLLALTPGPSPAERGEEVEACLQRALEVAREQEARWLELRATVSLARLWQGQGRRDEARELLAGIYHRFSEGFDTVDLVEAKALLKELE